MAKELSRQGGIADPPALDPNERVHVWPHLVSIEAIAALVYLVFLTLMSIFIDAPLVGLANPEQTPNPSKAPWYFLGLQELLLHMHPALAGVIVPTVVLVGLGVMPYIDNRKKGTGIWFYSAKGVPITLFSMLYTTLWNLGLIFVDEFLLVRNAEGVVTGHGLAPLLATWGLPSWFNTVAVPIFFMVLIPGSLVYIVRRRWQADTREVMIALYSFFFASFVVLTIIGTAFRGPGMELMWPWEVTAGIHH